MNTNVGTWRITEIEFRAGRPRRAAPTVRSEVLDGAAAVVAPGDAEE